MVTKKQMKTPRDLADECFKQLLSSTERTDYKGKTEKKKIEGGSTPDGTFKWIIIKNGNFSFAFPLNKKEYDKYKILEAEYWGKKC